MYQNYIFDLYGTLADIRTNERKASLWKYLASYMTLQGAAYTGAELKKACRRLIEELRRENHLRLNAASNVSDTSLSLEETEVNFGEVFRRLYAEKGVRTTDEMIAHAAVLYRALSLDYVRLYDGAADVLKELHARGKKVYLLSNAQRLFTEPELRSLGIYDLFDDVLISSDIGAVKPSPLFYGALFQKHGINPKVSVMVGNDWQADAWGAYRNGLASMYLHTAQSPELTGKLPPDCRVLENITDVLKF